MKHVLMLLIAILSVNISLASSCGTKISCKPGEKAKCEMMDGSYNIFQQINFLKLSSKMDLFLTDIYAYKIDKLGVVDCYYNEPTQPENWVVFKSGQTHSVIPRDNSEWIVRHDTLYCDPNIHSCLLYVLY